MTDELTTASEAILAIKAHFSIEEDVLVVWIGDDIRTAATYADDPKVRDGYSAALTLFCAGEYSATAAVLALLPRR